MAHVPQSPLLKVLVVDDYLDTAKVLAEMLEIDGFRAAAARDGHEALAIAHAFRPDVILLDIELPKLNGVEVCRALRKEHWAASVVIVAVTGHAGSNEVGWIMSAGFDCVLGKPCSYRTIEALLHSVREPSVLSQSGAGAHPPPSVKELRVGAG